MAKPILAILFVLTIISLPIAFADSDEKVEFGSELQETLGHFWALELNLDENNSQLALVHATHPIAELYGSMSDKLTDYPEFDAKLQQTLMDLQNKANTKVTREEAQEAIDEAKEIVAEAQELVIGDLANDDSFKAQLANILLETSKVEYAEAVNDGIIKEMAEFQDGSAFVWRAKELLATMNIDSSLKENISSNIMAVQQAYEKRDSPSEVSNLVDAVIADFEMISGVSSEKSEHMEEAFLSPIRQLNSGVLPNEIECKPELILVLNNYDSRPACVTDSGAEKLESLGWGTRA
jgi:septum formation inhibitor MinC